MLNKIAIIIPNWNGLKVLPACLDSIKKTNYKNFQVIVVDNGSSDGSQDYLKKEKTKAICLNKNYGVDYAVNLGIKKVKADFYIFLNNDIKIEDKNWLNKLVETSKREKAGIVGAKIVGKDNKIQFTWYGNRVYDKKDDGSFDFVKEVDSIAGVMMFIKKEVTEKIGLFDERYFFGRDDADYCFRARKAGFRVIYDGNIKIVHYGSYSYLLGKGDKGGKLYYYKQRGLILFSFLHLGYKEKIKAIIRVILESFLTKKDAGKKLSWNNLYFYANFPERLCLGIKAIYDGLRLI